MKSKTRITIVILMIVLAMVPILQACGSVNNDDESGTDKAKITWSTWGDPTLATRLKEVTKDFNGRHPNIKAELIMIPSEYEQKIITQLAGGTAPDAMYAGDSTIVKLIENDSIEELTPYLKGADSKSHPNDFFDGLWGAAKKDGKIYGVTVDDNPMVIWYNKKVLREAGIQEMPSDLYEKGEWTWDTFKDITHKVSASGKYGYVLDNWWGHYYSWVTTNGGQVYDDKGRFIAHENDKAVEAFQYLYDNVKAKKFTFAGTLPKGQGADAMFMSNQVAFVGAGRWYLNIFKNNKDLEYDIVPWPTNTGNKLEPAAIPTAYMVMNKATKHKKETFQFITDYVSKEGQIARLKAGGNAVPSIAGADEVVLDGGLPEHAQYFLDAREVGYALTPFEAGVPGLSGEITSILEELWLKDKDLAETLQKLGKKANQKIDEYKAGK